MVRTALFSASQVYRLAKDGRKKGEPGATFYSYIREKVYELLIDDDLGSDEKAKYPEWGNEMEGFVAKTIMKDRKWHNKPEDRLFDLDLHLTGELDFSKGAAVIELKSPFTKKSYLDLFFTLKAGTLKDTHPEYYWQLVAQKFLFGAKYANLLIFMPHESQKKDVLEHLDGGYFHGWGFDKLPHFKNDIPNCYLEDVFISGDDLTHLVEKLKQAKELFLELYKQLKNEQGKL